MGLGFDVWVGLKQIFWILVILGISLARVDFLGFWVCDLVLVSVCLGLNFGNFGVLEFCVLCFECFGCFWFGLRVWSCIRQNFCDFGFPGLSFC